MPFINTISEAEATGVTKEIYDTALQNAGYIPGYTRVFSHRPEVYQAWESLIKSIRGNLSLRRYELVTLATARELGGTYCMLAHSHAFLKSGEVTEAQLAAIAEDYHHAGLPPEEVAIMDYASKVTADASSVTQADVDRLKSFGLTDAEILDITLATTARNFFSKTLDALAAEPDAKFMAFDAELRELLSVGRPFGKPAEAAG